MATKSMIALCLFVAAATACPEFPAYRVQFAKSYPSLEHEQRAEAAFCTNLKNMQVQAASNPLARFAPNKFTDMSAESFKQFYHGLRVPTNVTEHLAKVGAVQFPAYSKDEIAKAANLSVDWVAKGAVTPVKNQLECGSCWAFSTTGNVEGQWFLAGHDLVSLSEQNILDCDKTDDACSGGLMTTAIQFIQNEGGIDTEESYPYVPVAGTNAVCKYNVSNKAASVSGLITVKSNEDEMATWVANNGPLAVAVDASSWAAYSGGILQTAISVQIDHGVLVTGYGEADGVKYWTIKNSWGAEWGESGYIRILRGADLCLITSLPVSAKVDKNA